MRSVTKDLSGAWAAAPPHGYPVRRERVDNASDNPRRSRRIKDTQPTDAQQGERAMSGRRPGPRSGRGRSGGPAGQVACPGGCPAA
jgi:hypothetical protein